MQGENRSKGTLDLFWPEGNDRWTCGGKWKQRFDAPNHHLQVENIPIVWLTDCGSKYKMEWSLYLNLLSGWFLNKYPWRLFLASNFFHSGKLVKILLLVKNGSILRFLFVILLCSASYCGLSGSNSKLHLALILFS